MPRVLNRIRLLVTGRAAWGEPGAEDVEVVKLSWGARWAITGVHSYNWWWVKRWGREPCGCTINPVTRRRLLFDSKCSEHWSVGHKLV
jgi:hypothetical protein